VLAADRRGDAGTSQERSRLEVLVAELDDVDPARDALAEEADQVGPVGVQR
jgi:hypothetical protein